MSDFEVGDTLYHHFSTRAFGTGIPTTLIGSPVAEAYEEASATGITAGVSLTIDHGETGHHLLTVVATGGNSFETDKTYGVSLTAGTVGGVSIVGEVIFNFTLGKSAAAKDLANATDGLGKIKDETALIVADTGTDGVKIGADAIGAANIADGAFVAANFAASSLDGKGDWNTTTPPTAVVIADQVLDRAAITLQDIEQLCLQTEDFATTWANLRSTESVNTIAAPDGQTTADTLIEDNTASSSHLIRQFITLVDATAYTFSVFVKSKEWSRVRLELQESVFPASVTANFNLNTGLVTATGGGEDSSSITDVGGGWFRVSITATTIVAGSEAAAIYLLNDSGNSSYNGDGASGLYLWGANLTIGRALQTYIPATTVAVTRAVAISGLNDPTVAAVVDEWETQSQADPTGFHVNVKEVSGTGQTAGDILARIPAALVNGRMDSSVDATGMESGAVTAVWAKAMTELAAVPGVTGTVLAALEWVFLLARNEGEQTSTTKTLKKDDGTALATAAISDDGTKFIRGKWS